MNNNDTNTNIIGMKHIQDTLVQRIQYKSNFDYHYYLHHLILMNNVLDIANIIHEWGKQSDETND